MILTCPQCATRYFLPDVQIGRGGRKVKCAQCGTTWREDPPLDDIVAVGPEGQTEPLAGPAPGAMAPPAPPPPAEEDPFTIGAARRADILRSKKEEADRKARQAAIVKAAVWEGLAAALVILLVLAAVFRGQVVQFAPGTATAYAAVGLPVNSAGLTIEKVQVAPSVLAGHRALMVTGVLRNVAAGPVKVPAFRVDLLDKNSHVLDRKVIQITAPPMQVGEARPFSLGVADPPSGYQEVDVTFAPAPPTPHAAAKPASPAAPGAHATPSPPASGPAPEPSKAGAA
jgi:predicted Zn finger-like uncharacterized protein